MRRNKPQSKVHWIGMCRFAYVFCGLIRKFEARRFSLRHCDVTCMNCRRLMKLHGHLEKQEP